jgi:hypothetical protein
MLLLLGYNSVVVPVNPSYIDSAAKRLAALDYEEVWAEAVPIPNNVPEKSDRWHMIWGYSIAGLPQNSPGRITMSETLRYTVGLSDSPVYTITGSDSMVYTVTVSDSDNP